MRAAFTPTNDLLAARFGRLSPLNDHERSVLRLIESRSKQSHREGAPLLTEGREIRTAQFIITGWACRFRELANGRRQIVSILLPGDTIGLSYCAHALSLTSVVALSPLRTVEAPEIAVAWRERLRVPGISTALDLAAAEDEFFMLAHIVRLGRQTAYERIAHWVMELEYRLSSRGLSTNGAFPMPLTQDTLGDAVGLSVVHVNRTLQQMRREGRIELARGRLAILDREALRAAGEFAAPMLTAPAMQAAPMADIRK
jgi:CRP-like cAMP-binding protein